MMASGLKWRNYINDGSCGLFGVEISEENFCLTGELKANFC
jgi:hypothetical protein